MYPVSDAFLQAIQSNTRKYYWTGTITTTAGVVYPFENKDIVKGSGYITRQCCGSTEIELGTVYAAEMGISLFSDIDRYTLDGAEIRLFFHLILADGTVESVQMGVFEVSEANRHIKTLELKAYDYMLRFEKTLKLESSSGTAYNFILAACTACKVEMAQLREEIEALTNGKEVLGIYADNDMETYRDLLHYVAQVIGCVCIINREGKLELIPYGNVPVCTIPAAERFSSSYSDFVTRYTAISSTNALKEIAEYYAVEPDNGLTMNLETNPLLQFGLQTTRARILESILHTITAVEYVPFDSTTIGNPALDPMDVLQFSGGHADESKLSCITSITCNINGKQSLKCVGKNPKLSSAKSKNDKNITGLLNQVESNKTVVYSFMNVTPYTVGSSPARVLDITFTSKESTTAMFLGEFLLDITANEFIRTIDGTAIYDEKLVSEDGTKTTESVERPVQYRFTEKGQPILTVTYKINGDTVDTFIPEKTCIDGRHILTLFYPLSAVIENAENTFEVYLSMSGGKAQIGELQIRATISGQGLVAGIGDWNGRINITESIGDVDFMDMNFTADSFTDSVSVIFPPKTLPGISQSIGNISFVGMNFTVDSFTDRKWVTEILRTFVLTAVRGNPKYNGYITVSNDEQFVLLRRYSLDSEPQSCNLGFVENLTLDTDFLVSTENIRINGHSAGHRLQKVVTVSDAGVLVPELINTANGFFELKAAGETTQTSVTAEIDEGRLETMTIDFSGFDGVKEVEFSI